MIKKLFLGALGLVLVIVIIGVATQSSGSKTKTAASPSSTAATQATSASPSSTPASTAAPTTTVEPITTIPARVVTGKLVTLGAGSFTSPGDVAPGLYNVTPGAGQSGNFIVSGTDSYNEVLGNAGGLGVPSVRAQISSGDTIEIDSLSAVTFTPVTTPYVTSHSLITLGAGTWVVGQDLGAGRYVATPGAGQSGNFIVSGNDDYNEVLGNADGLGVPSVTVSLS
ncbi:MAG: hypothetical protein ACP5P1_04810, partial [Acidimicrobiales bacterium]